jgi:hypothetical protein
MFESEDEGNNDAEAGADDDGGVGPSKKASPPTAKKSKCDKDEGDDCELFSVIYIYVCVDVLKGAMW